jgi:hypothetical protein
MSHRISFPHSLAGCLRVGSTTFVKRGPSILHLFYREQANCPSLRASSDHRFRVGALRVERIVRVVAMIFSPLFLRRMSAVGSTAAVERGPSQGTRSGSKEPMQASSSLFSP